MTKTLNKVKTFSSAYVSLVWNSTYATQNIPKTTLLFVKSFWEKRNKQKI